jgi:hypothetical protein
MTPMLLKEYVAKVQIIRAELDEDLCLKETN